MAGSAKTGVIRAVLSGALCLALCAMALAEPTITLQDAGARKPPEYTPLHDGRTVVVSGQVSTKPVRIGEVLHLAIEEKGYGLILEAAPRVFEQLSPGDWVEAHGRIAQRAGLPVLAVSKIAAVSAG